MSHSAAVVQYAKAPVRVQAIETPAPGPRELLVRNELIALAPIDAKLAKSAIFPLQYPIVLGSTFGGTVVAVGALVTNFAVGDRVAAAKGASPTASGDKHSAFQQYVVARTLTTSKIPDSVDLSIPVSLIGSLGTVVGLFTASLGLDKPVTKGIAIAKGKKILIYGGTSSVGSLSVQYVSQAGYNVVTTTSPKHEAYVSKLGAVKVIDHTKSDAALLEALVAEGPYDVVVDSISTPSTIQVTAGVVSAQGSGKVYALLPASGPERLPQGVAREFGSWSVALGREEHAELLEWTYGTYLPHALATRALTPLPTQKIAGGLRALDRALSRLLEGVSGVKIVVDPWEEGENA
ncbi:alcohol dehydrogenase GroES-like domain-containing protein [Stagonosporopsis vannaccii]|nr:alcohol dehydrogenase GroES-like domain-containing protein [Stagonosporopsis vannaccii]